MKRVFIVHGHDLTLRDAVSSYVSSLGLEPVVLSDLPNQGDTIIEKFERAAGACDYAIVLLTGDDQGSASNALSSLSQEAINNWAVTYALSANRNILPELASLLGQQQQIMQQRIFQALAALRQRARQNVILELGFFIGKLGRARVCVLAPRTVECPSDINGIATISTANDWRKELLRELQAAAMLS